ncbi:MAG: TolC family protein [Bacteroidales bacterium]|nr:TolC family protein [Bacteroidales bacterium]
MKRNILILALTLSFGTALSAQQTGKVWTLDDCIEYAIENNISLQQSRNTYLSGLEDTEQAKAAMLPTLSASTNQGLTNRPFSDNNSTVVGSQVYNTSNTSYSGNYGLNAGITLYKGGSLRTALKQQKIQNSIDSLSVAASTNDIIISIVQAYIQCLYAREAISVAENTAETSKAARDRAVELKEAGELSKVDVAQLESQYATHLYQVTTARTQFDNYKLQLKQLLELDITDEIQLADPSADEAKVLSLLPTKEQVYENAMETMPEIRKASLSVDAANLSIQQAKAGYAPTISASAGIGTTNISGSSASITEQIANNLNESLGLSISIPIFQGRRNKTAVNKAKIAANTSILQQQSAAKTLLQKVESTYLEAVSSQSQYISAKEQEKYAEQSLELTTEQFGVGMKNTVELITAQTTLLSARQQVLQSKYMTLLSMAILDIYQGRYEAI